MALTTPNMMPLLAYTLGSIHHPLITGVLLATAVLLTNICCLGLVIMPDSYQRLQFSFPVTALVTWLLAAAVWVEREDWQGPIKASLVALLMMVMNSVLTHATARAIRIRQVRHWEPTQDEKIPVVKDKGIAGSPAYDAPGGLQP